MNLQKLANVGQETKKKNEKVTDSSKNPAVQKRLRDSRMKSLKKRIKDSLDETETTEAAVEAIQPFLETDDPSEVMEVVVEVFGETIDTLEDIIEESEAE